MKKFFTKTVLALALLLTVSAWQASPAWGSSGMNDEAVLEKVAKRLDRKGLQDQGSIQVSIRDGAVSLAGSTETLRQAQRAEKVAANTKGVSTVESHLQISSFGRNPAAIRKDLQQVVDLELNTEVFDWVEVMEQDGQVLLTGQVLNPVTRNRVAKAVAAVPGVWHVEDSVEILPVSAFDSELRRQALYSLYTHPAFVGGAFSGRPEIHILVNRGRITLKGTVSSRVQAKLAESLVRASSTNYGVDNQILVTARQRS